MAVWTRGFAEVIPVLKEHVDALRAMLTSIVAADIRANWEGVEAAASLYKYIEAHAMDVPFMLALRKAFEERHLSFLLKPAPSPLSASRILRDTHEFVLCSNWSGLLQRFRSTLSAGASSFEVIVSDGHEYLFALHGTREIALVDCNDYEAYWRSQWESVKASSRLIELRETEAAPTVAYAGQPETDISLLSPILPQALEAIPRGEQWASYFCISGRIDVCLPLLWRLWFSEEFIPLSEENRSLILSQPARSITKSDLIQGDCDFDEKERKRLYEEEEIYFGRLDQIDEQLFLSPVLLSKQQSRAECFGFLLDWVRHADFYNKAIDKKDEQLLRRHFFTAPKMQPFGVGHRKFAESVGQGMKHSIAKQRPKELIKQGKKLEHTQDIYGPGVGADTIGDCNHATLLLQHLQLTHWICKQRNYTHIELSVSEFIRMLHTTGRECEDLLTCYSELYGGLPGKKFCIPARSSSEDSESVNYFFATPRWLLESMPSRTSWKRRHDAMDKNKQLRKRQTQLLSDSIAIQKDSINVVLFVLDGLERLDLVLKGTGAKLVKNESNRLHLYQMPSKSTWLLVHPEAASDFRCLSYYSHAMCFAGHGVRLALIGEATYSDEATQAPTVIAPGQLLYVTECGTKMHQWNSDAFTHPDEPQAVALCHGSKRVTPQRERAVATSVNIGSYWRLSACSSFPYFLLSWLQSIAGEGPAASRRTLHLVLHKPGHEAASVHALKLILDGQPAPCPVPLSLSPQLLQVPVMK